MDLAALGALAPATDVAAHGAALRAGLHDGAAGIAGPRFSSAFAWTQAERADASFQALHDGAARVRTELLPHLEGTIDPKAYAALDRTSSALLHHVDARDVATLSPGAVRTRSATAVGRAGRMQRALDTALTQFAGQARAHDAGIAMQRVRAASAELTRAVGGIVGRSERRTALLHDAASQTSALAGDGTVSDAARAEVAAHPVDHAARAAGVRASWHDLRGAARDLQNLDGFLPDARARKLAAARTTIADAARQLDEGEGIAGRTDADEVGYLATSLASAARTAGPEWLAREAGKLATRTDDLPQRMLAQAPEEDVGSAAGRSFRLASSIAANADLAGRPDLAATARETQHHALGLILPRT